MTRHLSNLKFYHWILAGAGLLLIGWLGVSFFAQSPSGPAAAEVLPERPATVVMEVRGMYSASCEQNVYRSLSELAGVEHVEIRLEDEEAKIWLADNAQIEDETLKERITQTGYEPEEIRRP
jgi:copper chaperone CopZ